MPLISRYFYIIASITLTGFLVWLANDITNPLLAAFILALALKPFVSLLDRWKFPRLLSTIIPVLFFISFFLGLITFFSLQISHINFELASLARTLSGISGKIQHFLSGFPGVSAEQQAAIFQETFMGFLKNSTSFINNTLSFTTSFLSAFILFVLSLFFLLYYRGLFVTFLTKMVRPEHHDILRTILGRMQTVVNHYIFGLALIITVIAILNTVGLLLLKVQHAVLFGILAAVFTLIPYIGIVIGSLIPMIFVFLTKSSLWYPLAVLVLFMSVQFLEGNFLTPNIVGRQISVNPFAAILGLITGGMLCGMVGIIFALPTLAIAKVVCDHVKPLHPFGYLIGNPSQ